MQPEKVAPALVTVSPTADPTWYSARDLDVYPRPVAPVRLDFLEPAGAQIVLQLLIDEHGTVREVTVIEATPRGEPEERARSALAGTRFTPAMKDARAVKSRVLLKLEPSTGARE